MRVWLSEYRVELSWLFKGNTIGHLKSLSKGFPMQIFVGIPVLSNYFSIWTLKGTLLILCAKLVLVFCLHLLFFLLYMSLVGFFFSCVSTCSSGLPTFFAEHQVLVCSSLFFGFAFYIGPQTLRTEAVKLHWVGWALSCNPWEEEEAPLLV